MSTPVIKAVGYSRCHRLVRGHSQQNIRSLGIHYRTSKSTGGKRHTAEINCQVRLMTLSAVELPSSDPRTAGRFKQRPAG